MNRIDPVAGRAGGCGSLTGEALQRHLFLCADCRGEVRLSAAWDALREERPDDPAPADAERFVTRVLEARRLDGFRRHRRHLLLAAAAVLLFFFAAGANSRSRAASPSAEEAYANLATASPLDDLLPE